MSTQENNIPKKYILSGVGLNHPGIVASICQVLDQWQCNIDDTSMTILDSYFAMLFLISVPEHTTVQEIQAKLAPILSSEHVSLSWFPLENSLSQTADSPSNDSGSLEWAYAMISVAGNDRTGITYRVSSLLAAAEWDITDLHAQQVNGQDGPVYIMMIETRRKICDALQDESQFKTVRSQLSQLAKELSIDIQCKPIDPIAL
ncbi:MAG: hypothetical protein K2X01_04665 [Cyanobacteria bacterium]|nr:hypothetical protein [Cyanobacteriota bacterium]